LRGCHGLGGDFNPAVILGIGLTGKAPALGELLRGEDLFFVQVRFCRSPFHHLHFAGLTFAFAPADIGYVGS